MTESSLDTARRAGGMAMRFRAGDVLFRPGDAPRGWIAIESGRLRLVLTSDNGREIVLYRLNVGDSCLLTTSALLNDGLLPAEAVAETDGLARVVPRPEFDRRMGQDSEFRAAVLRYYADRVAELVLVMQDVLFHGLPERLARWLVARPDAPDIEATHQEIASELGSAREVVSRLVARFERDGLVTSQRGRIHIVDSSGLERIGLLNVT